MMKGIQAAAVEAVVAVVAVVAVRNLNKLKRSYVKLKHDVKSETKKQN
jgi:hypothetical protein